MYGQHFRLREMPFGITPDTSFFFRSEAAQQALNTVLVAACAGEGFIKVTGEVGTGKTLLCRRLLNSLGPEFETAYIPVPSRSALGLLFDVADELAVDTSAVVQAPEFEHPHLLVKALLQRLTELAHAGRRVLVCLDEAQALSIETFESLRLLTNLETEKRKLVQVLIVGQPELDEKLAHPSIRQLRQRITFQHRLRPMSGAELGRYLQHRLEVAGYVGPQVFQPLAQALLRWHTGGYPRLVNIVAHKALLCAFGRGHRTVGLREMAVALADGGAGLRPSPRGVFACLGLCAAATVLVHLARIA